MEAVQEVERPAPAAGLSRGCMRGSGGAGSWGQRSRGEEELGSGEACAGLCLRCVLGVLKLLGLSARAGGVPCALRRRSQGRRFHSKGGGGLAPCPCQPNQICARLVATGAKRPDPARTKSSQARSGPARHGRTPGRRRPHARDRKPGPQTGWRRVSSARTDPNRRCQAAMISAEADAAISWSMVKWSKRKLDKRRPSGGQAVLRCSRAVKRSSGPTARGQASNPAGRKPRPQRSNQAGRHRVGSRSARGRSCARGSVNSAGRSGGEEGGSQLGPVACQMSRTRARACSCG